MQKLVNWNNKNGELFFTNSKTENLYMLVRAIAALGAFELALLNMVGQEWLSLHRLNKSNSTKKLEK